MRETLAFNEISNDSSNIFSHFWSMVTVTLSTHVYPDSSINIAPKYSAINWKDFFPSVGGMSKFLASGGEKENHVISPKVSKILNPRFKLLQGPCHPIFLDGRISCYHNAI